MHNYLHICEKSIIFALDLQSEVSKTLYNQSFI